MTLRPYGNNILIKPDKEFEKTLDSGLVVVSTTRHGYLISGEVVGAKLDDEIGRAGTTVYYSINDAEFIDIYGATFHIIDLENVRAYKFQD